MAYVVRRPNDAWEIRETVATSAGPRSRTLASFRELSDAVVVRALDRASRPTSAEEIRRAARRAGAPVGLAAADRAAAELLRELADGREPHPILRALLLEALRGSRPGRLGARLERADDRDPGHAGDGALPFESPDAALASAAWLAASPERRGEALADLLDLTDALPADPGTRMSRPRFPRLAPTP